jgi:hypothetical protein
MSTKILTISDPNLLAEFVRQEEFKGFFEKRFDVPPDYMGLLIRNGQFVEAYKGVHLSVNGMFDKLKGIIGGSTSVSLLLADLKTFQGTANMSAITKDNLKIEGQVVVDLQINPEKPQNILGLMSGRKALSKLDVFQRIVPHLPPRVFEAAVIRVNATEMRGNKGLQDLIQGDIMKEIERIAGDLGVLIRSVTVSFAINEVEKQEMAQAAALRAAAQAEFEFTQLKRQLEREHESTLIKINTKQELDKIELANPHELEKLVLAQEIDFVDARETGVRMQEMKVLQHEIQMIKTERLFKFDEAIAKATHEGVDMNVVSERRKVVLRNTELLDKEHERQLKVLERDAAAEDRLKLREEERTNRLQDRDYDHDSRAEELKIKDKERDFGFDTRNREVDVSHKEQRSKIEIQRDQDKAALDKLKGLQGLEIEMERERLERKIKEGDAAHERELALKKLAANTEIDKMQVGSKMSPEQLLAYNAGLSPAVAKVLEEQAKAKAIDLGEREKLMREMVSMAKDQNVASAAQAKAMFETGVAGAVGGAAAAASKSIPGKVAGLAGEVGAGGDVDCPKCGRTNTAKARFCVGCGEQLRK